MAKCDYCNATILFGGVKSGDYRFCNQECHHNGFAISYSEQIPEDIVNNNVFEIHHGSCPKCKKNGPVDVYTSYRVHSIVLMTSWRSIPEICCKSCGVKNQIWSGIYSFLFGWWGFPWGIIMTPVQITRNIKELAKGDNEPLPSENLKNQVRLLLAQQILREQQLRENQTGN